MQAEETDVVVAGGGVAGLTAAAALAAERIAVICVDPVPPVTEAAAPGSDLRSTAFLMPAIRLFERAGLWEPLEPYAAPLRVMRIADAGGADGGIRERADFVAGDVGEEVFGYNLPNWLMRRELVARLGALPEVDLRTGRQVVHVVPRTDKAIVRLDDGSQVAARLVVAADGRESGVREGLGIGVRRWSYGQKALAFSVEHTLDHEGVSTEIHRSGGPFTLVPLPDDGGRHRSAVVWMETGPRAQALAEMEPAAFEAELNARACGVLGTLSLASERRVWPIVSQVADRLDGPRAALIAEAAHVVPPIGAQGLNMSLRDVAALRDLVVAARDAGRDIGAPDLLRQYHRARHPDILARVVGVDALNRAAMAEAPGLRDLRRAGLRALHGFGPLRRTAMRLGLGAGR